MQLRDYQLDAIDKMRNGCILCGGVGSGKSLTSLGYYYLRQRGSKEFLNGGKYTNMQQPSDLYIITTARKRDTKEWDKELTPFLIGDPELYSNKVVIDSWNNIGKYVDVTNAFFIFDEQRVVGYGAWVKSFIKISRRNEWVLLSATPGDTWSDYIPVFIANGFFKNKTEFARDHIVYDHHVKFPKVSRYLDTGKLIRLRDRILVDMDFDRPTTSHHEDITVEYDRMTYREISKNRWDVIEDKPIDNAAQYCYTLRRLVNSDESRQTKILEIFEKHPKVIIFYNFDYELEILRNLAYGEDVPVAEWNGHYHHELPDSKEFDKWVYLVQYNAGCEGWNCITTDTIIFYSENYSYKVMQQAAGRIDRMNTPFKDLYYYHLKSKSSIDLAIAKALSKKKKFNEGKFFS